MHGRAGVQGGHQGVDGVVDVGAVDQGRPRADQRQPARAGRGRRSGPPAAGRPVPRPGADGSPPPPADRRRRRARAARPWPCSGRTGRGPCAESAGSGADPEQRRAGVRDRRRGHVHQPPDAGGPAGVDDRAGTGDVGRSYAGPGPGHVDLRGQVHDRVLTGHGARGRRRRRRRRPAPRAARARPDGAAAPSRRRPRSASARAVAAPSIPLAPVTRTFTAVPPGRPRSSRSAQRRQPEPVDLGRVPDVDRQAADRSAPPRPARSAPRGRPPPGSGSASGPRPSGRPCPAPRPRQLLGSGRADPDGGRRRAPRPPPRPRCSIPTGVSGPSAVVITCTSRPSTHSRPSGVEVPDVAGPVPAGVARALPARWPTAGRSGP